MVQSNLRQRLLVLDLAGAQEPEYIFGPLGHSVFHPVVMPQLFDTQLHAADILVTWSVGRISSSFLSDLARWRLWPSVWAAVCYRGAPLGVLSEVNA